MTGQISDPFGDLPQRLRERLIGFANPVAYSDEEFIHARGDTEPSMSFVQSGGVRLSNVGLDGKRITTTTLSAGEAYGIFTLFNDRPRSHDAHAVGPTRVLVLKREPFRRLLDEEPDLRDFVIAHLSDRLIRALEALEDERRLPLVDRLAKLLARRVKAIDGTIDVTQADLAQELGVSRNALGTSIAELQGLGLVATSYRRIQVPDQSALSAWIMRRQQIDSLLK